MTERKQFGGFDPGDGTIDFYLRVGTLADPKGVMVDLGAGRGAWFENASSGIRHSLRHMQGRFGEVIGVDVDDVVLTNRSVDRADVIRDDRLPLDTGSADVIVCDYVFEHIHDVSQFASEIDRVLKPGGWVCARTPHKMHYVAIASRIMSGATGDRVLHFAQPTRREIDVFPKHYKLNTLRHVRQAFPGYADHSFVFRSTPSYFFGRESVKSALHTIHRIMPTVFSGNIFAFLQKPNGAN